jgi:hypothetical protein
MSFKGKLPIVKVPIMYSTRQAKMEEVFDLLTFNKEIKQKEIPERIDASVRSIVRQLKYLEINGIIQAKTDRHIGTKGPALNVWSLTSFGLIEALVKSSIPHKPYENPKGIQAKMIESTEAIIKTHSDMLLTFRKWTLFEKANLKDFMLANLMQAIVKEINKKRLTFGTNQAPDLSKDWQDEFDATILTNPILDPKFQQLVETIKYRELCKQDKELNNFITTKLKMYEEQHHKELEAIKRW